MKKKYDHTKAQKYWHSVDPGENFYEMIKKQMQQTYSLPDFISRLAEEIKYKVTSNENLKNYIIIAAEAVYKGLDDPLVRNSLETNNKISTTTNKEELFDIVLSNLFFGLSEGDFDSAVIGEIQNYYENS